MWAINAQMYAWHSHLAYGEVRQVVDAGNVVYGLAGKALFSVDKASEELRTYSKQDGLNGADIAQIGYDELSRTLIIAYSDGLMDMIKDGAIIPMTDLQQKDMAYSKETNKILVVEGNAYMAMPFGVMVVDVKNRLIKDTYYIGDKSAAVNVLDVALSTDSIFAISSDSLYSASKNANLLNYKEWNKVGKISASKAYTSIAVWRNELFAVAENMFAHRNNGKWTSEHPDWHFIGIKTDHDNLFVLPAGTDIYYLDDNFSIKALPVPYQGRDVCREGNTYWLATPADGIVRLNSEGTQSFKVNGPVVNIPYRLKIANQRLYVVPGQRWATEEPRIDPDIMIYDIAKDIWKNIPSAKVMEQTDYYVFDLMNVAVDPFNSEHFYVTSYGTGLLECMGTDVINRFSLHNSPLETAAPGDREGSYVRTDGALFDESGNLWLLNASMNNLIHVATPTQLADAQESGVGDWYKMSARVGSSPVFIPTPGEMFIDNRYPNWKWVPSLRYNTGLLLLDDNGTPQYSLDDVATFRETFVDQDGKVVEPLEIYAVAQDKDGALWIALEKGVITIPSTVNFKKSNTCERIKIPRNDGTGLADYLLETEKINAIVVDGSNRKWFGTASSGLFLISADGQETIYHFTEDNSPLLSNNVISLAIEPITGKVFIGTEKGLMSYQSDASSPFEDYSNAYAYPNPVRPNYTGPITITGLMDESVVHIVDNAGNLVCETYSNGGSAIWDGRTADGHRAASGVYSVLCNADGGKHTVVKILLMH